MGSEEKVFWEEEAGVCFGDRVGSKKEDKVNVNSDHYHLLGTCWVLDKS